MFDLFVIDNADITNKFSLLSTNTLYFDNLYDLVDNCINFLKIDIVRSQLDKSTLDKILILFENDLYISQLTLISSAIPSEIVSISNMNNFGMYSLRILDQFIDKQITQNVAINLTKHDTEKGRPDFFDFYQPFDSIDLISIVLQSYDLYSQIQINDNDSKRKYIISDRLTLTLLANWLYNDTNYDNNSNYSGLHYLDDIVTMEFDFESGYTDNISNSSGNAECGWYNEENSDWENYGCEIKIIRNFNTGICRCNHLTTFAILWHIDDEETTFSHDEFYKNPMFILGLAGLIIGYGLIVIFIIKLFFKLRKYHIPICKKGEKFEIAIGALFFAFVQAILEIMSCILFYMYVIFVNGNIGGDFEYKTTDSKLISDVFTQFVTIGLFLPLIVSFYIFSCVIYGLAIVSQSASPRVKVLRSQIGTIAKYTNIFVTIGLIGVLVALFFNIPNTIYSIVFVCFEIVYCVLLLIVLVLINYFSYLASHVISKSVKMLQQAVNEAHRSPSLKSTLTLPAARKLSENIEIDSNYKEVDARRIALNRILVATVALSLFLLIQMILVIYFTIYPKNYHPIFQLIDLFLNFLFLAMVIYLYHHYAEAKVQCKIEDIKFEETQRQLRQSLSKKRRRNQYHRSKHTHVHPHKNKNTNKNKNKDDNTSTQVQISTIHTRGGSRGSRGSSGSSGTSTSTATITNTATATDSHTHGSPSGEMRMGMGMGMGMQPMSIARVNTKSRSTVASRTSRIVSPSHESVNYTTRTARIEHEHDSVNMRDIDNDDNDDDIGNNCIETLEKLSLRARIKSGSSSNELDELNELNALNATVLRKIPVSFARPKLFLNNENVGSATDSEMSLSKSNANSLSNRATITVTFRDGTSTTVGGNTNAFRPSSPTIDEHPALSENEETEMDANEDTVVSPVCIYVFMYL